MDFRTNHHDPRGRKKNRMNEKVKDYAAMLSLVKPKGLLVFINNLKASMKLRDYE